MSTPDRSQIQGAMLSTNTGPDGATSLPADHAPDSTKAGDVGGRDGRPSAQVGGMAGEALLDALVAISCRPWGTPLGSETYHLGITPEQAQELIDALRVSRMAEAIARPESEAVADETHRFDVRFQNRLRGLRS